MAAARRPVRLLNALDGWVPSTSLVRANVVRGRTVESVIITFADGWQVMAFADGWQVMALSTGSGGRGVQAVLDDHSHRLLGENLTLEEAVRIGDEYLRGCRTRRREAKCPCPEIVDEAVDWAAVDERNRQALA